MIPILPSLSCNCSGRYSGAGSRISTYDSQSFWLVESYTILVSLEVLYGNLCTCEVEEIRVLVKFIKDRSGPIFYI